ncbi:MAG: metal-sulfur cluster assembly factor [Actinomycetota bacterium]
MATDTQKINEEEIWEALKVVTDPEIGIDVVNLGLIYGLDIEDSKVKVRMTLTSMGCPATGLIEFQAVEAVKTVEGVEDCVVEFSFDPPWGPDRMTEEGRDMLQAMGY